MLKRIAFLFLFACSAVLGAMAQKYLNLGFADGSTASFVLADDLSLSVNASALVVSNATGSASYSVGDVCKYEYSDIATSGIAAKPMQAPVVSIMPDGLEILFPTPGHTCRVYDAAGRQILSQQVADKFYLSTGTLAAGVYIVNIDGALSLKVSLK